MHILGSGTQIACLTPILAGSNQPFTPVKVTPYTNARWASKKSIVTGSVKSTQAAIISS